MRVEVSQTGSTFRYRLFPDDDDPRVAERRFSNVREELQLVNLEYETKLPRELETVHPDAHATAIWTVLRPFLGSNLRLPFGVSEPYAAEMKERFAIELAADQGLSPRRAPANPRPCLLFSGGVDSLAASLVLPADTVLLFLDRIPRLPDAPPNPNALIELEHAKALCAALQQDGREVHIVRDDHESLFRPYPTWHSTMYSLPGLYLADTLGLGQLETGDVLGIRFLGGYHDGSRQTWQFRPNPQGRSPERRDPSARSHGAMDALPLVGLSKVTSIFGLSEVGTALVVNRSPFQGQAASCYYRSKTNYCMRCDKCFKKVILDHIFDDQEVPAELFEHFLSFRHLDAIFRRPFFDWHHIWFYIFQKIRCTHPFARELQAQAQRGPDLSLLEKWYPKTDTMIPSHYRDEVVRRINEYTSSMTDDEVNALETLSVPPLSAPAGGTAGQTAGVAVGDSQPHRLQEAGGVSGTRESLEDVTRSVKRALTMARQVGVTGNFVCQSGPVVQGDDRFGIAISDHQVRLQAAIIGHPVPEPDNEERTCYGLFCRFFPDGGNDELVKVARVLATVLGEGIVSGTSAKDLSLLERVETAVGAGGGATLAGYQASWPLCHRPGSIVVSLFNGEEWLDLFLEEKRQCERYYAASRAIAVSHFAHTAVDSKAKEQAVRLLVQRLRAAED
ncbi:DUF6395 domain-containing protein [Myxococcota bacterium]